MIELEGPRVCLRELRSNDAPFILELLNDPAFLRYIGDRGVRTLAQAQGYIATGPIRSYEQHGHGLLFVGDQSGIPYGLCGLVHREYFPDPDLGFAFLAPFRSQGFAREASEAVLADARDRLGLKRVLAIVQPDNAASLKLLGKLGFNWERNFRLAASDPALSVLALHFADARC